MDIRALQQQIVSHHDEENADNQGSLPPVDKWDPNFCGDLNIVIKRNGQWWYEGTPFTRQKLIQLFASVLKKEDDKYYLVTPVEKVGIHVEDVPFVVIDDVVKDGKIQVKTLTGDVLTISNDHPVELRDFDGNLVPYINIRRNLWARVHQNVLYRWVELAKVEPISPPLLSSSEREEQQESRANTYSLMLTSHDYSFSIGHIKEDE